ncbi:caspase-like, partial [Trichoplusia ni]|uniref:Caspase-like n=1 Tax=Trichoplusia ni TaxID=7111 RepID=A0A7E5WZE5_TRINI
FFSSNPFDVPGDEGPKFNKDSLYYDMSGDKYLVILNHHEFQSTRYFRFRKPSTRNGTDNDVKSLTEVFKHFGFDTSNVFRNLVYEDIIKNLTAIATQDHSKTSCICVAILTHGDKGGELHAADRPYLLSDVMNIFEKQPSLVNKPKLFFVQACRGANADDGMTVQLDSENVMTVPSHADFLLLCSTVEDYLSYRDINGSWMIQALCQVISENYEDLDLLHMITLVNRKVAYERVTYTRDAKTHNKKQMPETRFTLTKLLKFSAESQ